MNAAIAIKAKALSEMLGSIIVDDPLVRIFIGHYRRQRQASRNLVSLDNFQIEMKTAAVVSGSK